MYFSLVQTLNSPARPVIVVIVHVEEPRERGVLLKPRDSFQFKSVVAAEVHKEAVTLFASLENATPVQLGVTHWIVVATTTTITIILKIVRRFVIKCVTKVI